jgi:urease accessory protein
MSETFGVSGGVQLDCRCNAEGLPYLSSQRFSPPVHLSKPYLDHHSGSLLINLSCPTAGMLSGDRMVCDLQLNDHSSMVVTTPGATRSHFMQSGIAKVDQSFRINDHSFLEYNPGSLILQESTSLRQNTRIELSENAELLFVEKIMPGRVAHGELFKFNKFSNRMKIRKDKTLILSESFSLEPENDSIHAWKRSFPTPFYGCFYLISPRVENSLPSRQAIHDLKSEYLLIGSSQMHLNVGWIIKVLAGDAIEFRRAMKRVRSLIYNDLGRTATDFRRY